jgi:hypothetical protein
MEILAEKERPRLPAGVGVQGGSGLISGLISYLISFFTLHSCSSSQDSEYSRPGKVWETVVEVAQVSSIAHSVLEKERGWRGLIPATDS